MSSFSGFMAFLVGAVARPRRGWREPVLDLLKRKALLGQPVGLSDVCDEFPGLGRKAAYGVLSHLEREGRTYRTQGGGWSVRRGEM